MEKARTGASRQVIPSPATREPYRVLFLCTGNSARSIMAECAMNRWGAGRFVAFSAGSHPRGRVHPAALELLRQLGYSTEGASQQELGRVREAGEPASRFRVHRV